MDTQISAKNAFQSLNFSKVPDNIQPLYLVPYLNRNIKHKSSAGLLICNEIGPTFNSSDLFREFSNYGDLYAINVSPVAKGFVCFVLFKHYADAIAASDKMENTIIYEVDPILGTRFFAQNRRSPNFTFVTFGHPQISAAPLLHKKIDPSSLSSLVYTVYDKCNKTRTLVLKFDSEDSLNKVVNDYIQKYPNSHYELIGTSTYQAVFDSIRLLSFHYTEPLYLVRNIDDRITNYNLRLGFEKFAPVSVAMHINMDNYAIVQFKQPINNHDEKLLRLFPNPIFLEPVLHGKTNIETEENLSQSEYNAQFQPQKFILSEVSKMDNTPDRRVTRRAQSVLVEIPRTESMQIALDQTRFNKFYHNCNEMEKI